MSVVNAIPLIAAGDDGYSLSRSLRFRSSASAYLNRTFGAGSQTTWTFSAWVKLGTLGTDRALLSCGSGATDSLIYFQGSTNQILINLDNATYRRTAQVFRDPSAWYHIVVVLNTSNATAQNRLRLYINGAEVTDWALNSTVALNSTPSFNSAIAHNISRYIAGSSLYFDGYMAEVNVIDGQALTPSSFGAYSIYNQWLPKKYAGTYGTNGFYLPFTNNASAATLGNDFSGNSNTWTTNNISVTAGATYDSMTDVPTLTSATAANYAVLNPLAFNPTYISNGNLLFAGANLTSVRGSFQIPSTGMWYWELTPTTTMPNYVSIGLAEKSTTGSANTGSANTWGLYPTTTMYTWAGASSTNTGISTPALGCTFALAFDASTGKLWLGYAASGAGSITWIGGGSPALGTSPTYTLSTTLELFPFVCSNNSTADKSSINFGQQPFAYTPPTGYLALNTFNL